MLHRELELEVRAGIAPASALQIATFNAARLLKKESELGSIAPGSELISYLWKAILPNASVTFADAGW